MTCVVTVNKLRRGVRLSRGLKWVRTNAIEFRELCEELIQDVVLR